MKKNLEQPQGTITYDEASAVKGVFLTCDQTCRPMTQTNCGRQLADKEGASWSP